MAREHPGRFRLWVVEARLWVVVGGLGLEVGCGSLKEVDLGRSWRAVVGRLCRRRCCCCFLVGDVVGFGCRNHLAAGIVPAAVQDLD